jgi:hypothetical protein
VKLVLLFFFSALSAWGQVIVDLPSVRPAAISNSSADTFQVQSNQANQDAALARRYQQVRMECIQNRRIIAGKIVKLLPEGLVVDSGYTNLMRAPLNSSWLIPGTVTAARPANLVEASQPDAICVGLVFVADLPKGRGASAKPKLFDYVCLEGFPVGQYTYTSVGDLQRTVREFTTKLQNATRWNFDQQEHPNAPPK